MVYLLHEIYTCIDTIREKYLFRLYLIITTILITVNITILGIGIWIINSDQLINYYKGGLAAIIISSFSLFILICRILYFLYQVMIEAIKKID